MSLKDCIRNAAAAGHITKDEAKKLERRFDSLVKARGAAKARDDMINELTAEAAQRKRVALLNEQVRKVRTQDMFNYRTAKGDQDPGEGMIRMLDAEEGGMSGTDVTHLWKKLASEAHGRLGALLDDQRRGFFTGDWRRRMPKQKARQLNIVRALRGEKVDDPMAAQFAASAAEVMEDLRQQLNGAGANIPKLENWGGPQYWDKAALLKHGREAFINDLMGKGDKKIGVGRDKMIHYLAGRPMTDDELREGLEFAFETITTDGANKWQPSGAKQGRAMWAQRMDHRFIIFRDADAAWAAAQKYGVPDVHAAIMNHIASVTHDIATMRVFGPSPETNVTYLKQVAEQHSKMVRPLDAIVAELATRLKAADPFRDPDVQDRVDRLAEAVGKTSRALEKEQKRSAVGREKRLAEAQARFDEALAQYDDLLLNMGVDTDKLSQELKAARDRRALFAAPAGKDPAGRTASSLKRFDHMWQAWTGGGNVPTGRGEVWAMAAQSVRNVITAEAMGSSGVTALSDAGRQSVARAMLIGFKNPDARPFAVLRDYVGMLGRASKQEMIEAELLAEEALHMMHTQSRWNGGLIATRSVTGFFADRTLHFSGTSWLSQAGRHVHGMFMLTQMAKFSGSTFDQLPDGFKYLFRETGISPADWDVLRQARQHEFRNGVTGIRPKEVREIAGQALADRYHMMVLRLMDATIPDNLLRFESYKMQYGAPGSLPRELANFGMQFKSFGIMVIMLDAMRALREAGEGRLGRGVGFLAGTAFAMTMFGALVLQIKALRDGRDPRDMTNPKFWVAAFLAGGSAGLYGDFLFADYSRYGAGPVSTAMGPAFSKLESTLRLTVGETQKAFDGAPSKPGARALEIWKQWDPMFGSLHVTRLAYERMLMDRLQRIVDPDAYKAWRRREKRHVEKYGNRSWWAPGTSSPQRAPNLGAAFGGS